MMRRLFLLLLIATTALAHAEIRVAWDKTEYSFGTIREDAGKVHTSFTLRNCGSDSITVQRIRSSCGCTLVTYDHRTVAAGDSLRLEVAFDPKFRPGTFDKLIAVTISDEPHMLKIKGKVIASDSTLNSFYPIQAGNLRLDYPQISFGKIKQHSRRTANVTVYNPTADTLRLHLEDLPDCMKEAIWIQALPPYELATVGVTLSPKNEDFGLLSHQVVLCDDRGARFPLEVTAQVIPDHPMRQSEKRPVIEVAGKVDFSPMKGIVERLLTVANAGSQPLRLQRVTSMEDAVTVVSVPSTLQPGEKADIVLRLDASKLTTEVLNSSLVIFCNDPLNPTPQIRTVGSIDNN